MFKKFAIPVIFFSLITGPGAVDAWMSLIGKLNNNEEKQASLDLTAFSDIYQLLFPLLGLLLLMFWIWWTRPRTQIDVQQNSQIGGNTIQPPTHFASPDELVASRLDGKDLRITDLARESSLIRNRTFIGCRIFGPAAVNVRGNTSMISCGFDTGGLGADAILWQVSNQFIFGAIVLEDCQFQDCQFIRIAFVGSREMIDKIRQGTNP